MKLSHERMTGTVFEVGDTVAVSEPSLTVNSIEVHESGEATVSIEDTSTVILSAGDTVSLNGATKNIRLLFILTISEISCDTLTGIATATHTHQSTWNQAISVQVLESGDEILLSGTTNFDGQHRVISATSDPPKFTFSVGACAVSSETSLSAEGTAYLIASVLDAVEVVVVGTPTSTEFSFDVLGTFLAEGRKSLPPDAGSLRSDNVPSKAGISNLFADSVYTVTEIGGDLSYTVLSLSSTVNPLPMMGSTQEFLVRSQKCHRNIIETDIIQWSLRGGRDHCG